MTTQQLIQEFEALTRDEQQTPAREIERRLKGNDTPENGAGHDEPQEAQRERRRAAAQRLHGVLRGDGPPPSDEDIARMRDEYLMEKLG